MNKNNLKVIYLACGKARLNYNFVVYNDRYLDCDLQCDMLDVNLEDYDFIIATPPCNYYSRANTRCETSIYAQNTKHLLPSIIDKCLNLGKPFIIENVRSKPKFLKLGLLSKPCFIYFHGRHTYWSNIWIDFSHIPQTFDFNYYSKRLKKDVQGGDNVNNVFDYILENFKNIGGTFCV